MTFNFERAFQNPKPSLPCTEADGAKDWFEMKRGPGGESTSLTSYLLPQQAVFNSSHGAQYTSSLYPDTLLCQDHEMLDDDTFLYEMDIATPLLTTHSLTKRLSALPTPSDSQEEEIGHTPTDCSMTSMTSDLSCAREMAHLAFRKLVGGRQSKSRPGIKVISRRPTLTLPTLAPSLFSPGYAEVSPTAHSCLQIIRHDK